MKVTTLLKRFATIGIVTAVGLAACGAPPSTEIPAEVVEIVVTATYTYTPQPTATFTPQPTEAATETPEPTRTPTRRPTATSEPTATDVVELPTATVAPTVEPSSEEPLFIADWQDTVRWRRFELSEGTDINYVVRSDMLFVRVNEINTTAYYIYVDEQLYDNTQIEADVELVAGPNFNNIGVVCRESPKGWYEFSLDSSGYWTIWRADNTEIVSLAEGESDAINTDKAQNKLTAVCYEEHLLLYINDELVGETTDDLHTSGFFGLAVSAFDIPGTSVEFTNYVVNEPTTDEVMALKEEAEGESNTVEINVGGITATPTGEDIATPEVIEAGDGDNTLTIINSDIEVFCQVFLNGEDYLNGERLEQGATLEISGLTNGSYNLRLDACDGSAWLRDTFVIDRNIEYAVQQPEDEDPTSNALILINESGASYCSILLNGEEYLDGTLLSNGGVVEIQNLDAGIYSLNMLSCNQEFFVETELEVNEDVTFKIEP